MAQSKRRDAWDHTALLVSVVANIMRDPKKGKTVTAEEIHPFYAKPKQVVKVPLTVLRDVFVKKKG